MRTIRLSPALLLLAVLFTGCDSFSETVAPDFVATDAALASQSPHYFEAPFTATALCGDPIGNIRFTGTIRGVDHTTVDGRGETHRTRQFRVHGLTALNLMTGATYTVQGGAEMLTWHSHLGQISGNPLRSIHAGTLVFKPDAGGARVVAHHAIRFIQNAQGETVVDFHEWRCRTSGR